MKDNPLNAVQGYDQIPGVLLSIHGLDIAQNKLTSHLLYTYVHTCRNR